MTATLDLPRRIRATVGPKVLSRSPQIFDQKISTVLNELLQNSRRAGATRVHIVVERINDATCSVLISDNGCGIDDPSVVLQFGGSGWAKEIDDRERAAGMGIYSLASRGCTISSNGWQAVLTPAVFTGDEEADVLPFDHARGTTIAFVADAPENRLRCAVDHAVRYYPIPVTFNGETLTQGDFLAKALHIKETNDVRIGIIAAQHYDTSIDYVNFYGQTVYGKPLCTLEYVNRRRFVAIVDVIKAPDLELVLPDRRGVIENEYLAGLKEIAYIALLEFAGKDPEHQLGFGDYRKAREYGIPIEPPAILLSSWRGKTLNGDDIDVESKLIPASEGTCVILDTGLLNDGCTNALEVTLHAALYNPESGADLPFTFVRENKRYEGYPAYDRIPRVTAITHRAIYGTDTYLIGPDDAIPAFVTENVRADELYIDVSIERRASTTTYPIPADTLLFSGAEAEVGCVIFVVTRDFSSVDQLAHYLVDATFSYTQDQDCDSYDTQLEYHKAEARKIAARALLTTEEALVDQLESSTRDLRYHVRHDGLDAIEITRSQTVYRFANGETIRRARQITDPVLYVSVTESGDVGFAGEGHSGTTEIHGTEDLKRFLETEPVRDHMALSVHIFQTRAAGEAAMAAYNDIDASYVRACMVTDKVGDCYVIFDYPDNTETTVVFYDHR